MALSESQYFTLKKLHSLSGIIPVGGFVSFHMFENARSLQGAGAYNELTTMMRALPLLYLLEVGLLGGIAFHAIVGAYIGLRGRPNLSSFPERSNWMYWFQRISGFILLAFISYHLYLTRFADIPADQMFQTLAKDYQNPLILWFYIVGVASAAFHLGNGVWGFSIAWGIVTGQRSQDLLWKASMGIAAVLFLFGINALLGFNGHGLNFLQPEHVPSVLGALPVAK